MHPPANGMEALVVLINNNNNKSGRRKRRFLLVVLVPSSFRIRILTIQIKPFLLIGTVRDTLLILTRTNDKDDDNKKYKRRMMKNSFLPISVPTKDLPTGVRKVPVTMMIHLTSTVTTTMILTFVVLLLSTIIPIL